MIRDGLALINGKMLGSEVAKKPELLPAKDCLYLSGNSWHPPLPEEFLEESLFLDDGDPRTFRKYTIDDSVLIFGDG